jgi:hypothetical protein
MTAVWARAAAWPGRHDDDMDQAKVKAYLLMMMLATALMLALVVMTASGVATR